MIRRARLSFKPNVRPGGRSVGSGTRDGGSQPEEPVQAGEGTACPEKSIGDESPAQRTPDIPEKAAAISSENEPSKPATAPLQRRKRISTLPNIAKPRVSTSVPVTPSQKPQEVESPPGLPVSSVPSKDEVSPPEKAKVPNSPQSSNSAPQGQHVTLPEKRTPIPQVPQFSPFKKASLKHPDLSPVKSVDFTQKEEFSPLKERPSQKSSPNECKKSTPKMLVASGNLEKVRIRRAQKLRELLKDELRKERKEWKAKHPVITNIGEQERSKMVMRDFIYFIPENNPMKSSFAEKRSNEKAPTESQLSGTPVKNISKDEDDDMDEEEEEEDSQLLVPRVKVAEDGSIILDEESLTVEVSRGKAPIVEGNDPIFERGSTTTYSSFRKSSYTKPWSEEETDMFYLAISMVGTDFSMIGQLFPHRERIEIKNKFKREERANSWRIDKAFKEKTAFDLVFFSKRLEKALEAAKKKRTAPRVRQPREKKATKPRKKSKDKAAAEHVLSDEEMAMLSDGEGADTRTEEKENKGSVSVKECLLPSDSVPGKKKRNQKKKDTKEPEEEKRKSLPEDITTLPKKPRKKKSAEQVQDSELVKDKNLEDVQEAPDIVREKKKKSRKKKSTDEEAKPEITADGDIIDVPSPSRDGVDEKSTGSALLNDADSLMCIESEEPSFTQPGVLSCAEESSLILFTEDSECFSEPDDISSLQDSLSVKPGSQTLEDQTGSFDNVLVETSQEDSVFETSCHLTSDSPKQAPLEEDMAKNSHTGTEVEGSTDSQKESPSRPAALARGRFQRPRPNIPMRTLARQEKVLVSERDDIAEKRNDLPADNSSPQSHQKNKSITVNLEIEESEFSIPGSPRKKDIPCPVQTDSSLESPQLHPGDSDIIPPECAAAKEDIKTEKSLPIRGRLIRPKPNLKKAPVKEKPHSPERRSPPNSDSQDSGEIAMVPCTVVLTPLSNNEEDPLTKEKADSSTSYQEDCTKSAIKPAQLVRGYLQRPKPNTTKNSRKEKCEDMEGSEKCDNASSENATGVTGSKAICSQNDALLENREEQEDMSIHKDTCLDFATVQDSCIPIKEALSTPLSPVQEVMPEPDSEVSLMSESNVESKMSPIKLPQGGQLQRLKPNVLKSCDNKGLSGMRLEENVDNSPEDTGQDVKGKLDDLSDLSKPTDFIKEASTSDANCGHLENRMQPEVMDQVLPRDPQVGPNLSEEVQQPAKPTVLTRGRLQRPKPNIVRALPRRGVLTSSDNSRNKSEVETGEKAPESSQPATSLSQFESEKALLLAKAATEDMPTTEEMAHSHVLSLETISLPGTDQIESEASPSVFVDDSAPVGMKKELSGSEDEKSSAPTKPTFTRSRLLKPKPNLCSSVARTTVSAAQKRDVPEEGKSRKDNFNASSMESASQYDAGKKTILSNTDTEDTAFPEEITQSYIPPLETSALPGVDHMDSEKSSAVSMDNSSHVAIKNNLSTSEDEKMVEPSPGLTRSRLQRPKPNLGRSVTRPVLSAPQKCDEERKTTRDSFDTSSIEKTGISREKQNVDLSHESCPAEGYGIQLGTEEAQGGSVEPSVQLEQSSCTEEQVKEPSAKPLRNRFQKPKPNLGRAALRKESGSFTLEQKKVSCDSTSKKPEHLENKEGSGLVFTNDTAGSNGVNSTQHTTIKPAQLRRSRLVRPVLIHGKPSNKRLSALQSKTVDEEETSTDTDLEVSSSKRKASECFPDVSPKRSCIPDTSQNSSDSALDQVPSNSALPDSSQSNDMLEENKQQHSRFGRLLKTPPVLPKPTENVTERPEKKTSRNIKSVKSTVAKPMPSKGKGKTTLVKIRAMKQDEDDDEDELEYEDEDYDVAPDKLNQAPVFVPFSLRSPKPIPAEIEETVEEFEIPVEDLGVPINTAQNLGSPSPMLQDVSQHVPVSQADPGNKGHCDGSTEAAMTLISIGNSVFQSKLGEPLDSKQCTGSQLCLNADCKPEASTLSVQMVCATENDTTLNARSVTICQDTTELQVGNNALSVSANEQSIDLHTSDQPSYPLNVNVTLPLEQMSYPIIPDDVQQQDCIMSDSLLEGGAGEETFILTLVEIPISEGYSYPCEENSVDVLPAPVLITSGSSQVATPDQRTAASSEPLSSVSCPSGRGEVKLERSPPSRKRSASISSENDQPQLCIKTLRCTSAEPGENPTTNTTAAFEENETSSIPAEIKTEETKELHPSSMDIAVSSPEGEKMLECTVDSSTRFGTVAHTENPASTSYDSSSSVLPSSSSSRIQQRPGKKPLGFLPLVCKEKSSKKTIVASKKKSSKPKSKKAKVQKPEEQNALSNEMLCQSSSSAVTSTPAKTIPCTSQVSENLDTLTQESPKSQELATEEDASTVSEYFFSDIFMEVDE